MSLNVHVVKKHAEYGDVEAFNWKFEEFHSFLDALGCDVSAEDDYAENFECGEDNYEDALNFLKVYKEKGADCKEVKKFFKENVDYTIGELEQDLETLGGLDYVLQAMQMLWDEREKDYGWISFSAW